ncbi:hypothetical protein ABEV41_00090 [Geobacillus thermodenitrificans]|jgi:hypothetical protein|uniref:hypothetical protein n=1 Tax=Geobacillus thermodenitrificans TaxID=33940 RepID=UPI003D1D5CAC
MNIQITSINIRYENNELVGVQVYFTGNNEDRSINLNGYIPLTAEEYMGNEAISTVTEIVRQCVVDKLLNDGNSAE